MFERFIDEEDAVSRVVGIILMLAITIILAALITSFLIGQGDPNDPAPTMSLDPELEENDTYKPANPPPSTGVYSPSDGYIVDRLVISHEGGDNIDASDIRIEIEGTRAKYVNETDYLKDIGDLSAPYWGYGTSATLDDLGVEGEFKPGDDVTLITTWHDHVFLPIDMLRYGSVSLIYEGEGRTVLLDTWEGEFS